VPPYDWNGVGAVPAWPTPVTLHDETLRDGLQCPSLPDPPLAVKLQVVRLLDHAGVASTCLALPAAGSRAATHARALLSLIHQERLHIRPVLAARTTRSDIDAVVACAQGIPVPIEITCFLGASPIRRWVEGWSTDWLVQQAHTALSHARQAGLHVSFVLEDTTRTPPDMLTRLFDAALEQGARRLVLCDTVGHATPAGVQRLVGWTRRYLHERGARVGLDWHAHDDRGLATANALAAARAGCDRIHGCLAGVGERVGNADLEALAHELDRRGAGSWRPHALEQAARVLFERPALRMAG